MKAIVVGPVDPATKAGRILHYAEAQAIAALVNAEMNLLAAKTGWFFDLWNLAERKTEHARE